MTIYDISVPITADLPIYEGDPPTVVQAWARMAAGDLADLRSLSMGTHTGTHIDAPAHFLPGAGTVDALDLAACIGPALVLDLTSSDRNTIDPSALDACRGSGARRILLKTRNSCLWRERGYRAEFAALTPEAAALLVEWGVQLVGIDYLSIAPADDPATVHRILLSAGVVILEGLDLSDVPAGSFTLVCLPLRLAGADGAPARAVLIDER